MKRFATSPAPFRVRPASVRRIMLTVVAMLVPAVVAMVAVEGPGVLVQIFVATLSALASEALSLRLRRVPLQPALTDGSAVVTAVLFAMALPPLAPWWIAASGTAFAIGFVKHLFGGLGRNLFNPAMAGFVLVLLVFPSSMARWPATDAAEGAQALSFSETVQVVLTGKPPATMTWDAISAATPLDVLRTGLGSGYTMAEIRAGEAPGGAATPGSLWIAAGTVAGGLGLLALGIVRWHIPVSMLLATLVTAGLLHSADPGRYPDVVFHLTTGATLLGVFFIACDPVTAATSDRGRLWFGAATGVLAVALRHAGPHAEGLAFAVLTLNLLVPLIDRWTVPRHHGS